ncbi:similar to Saccharomyces cerevisiae YMR072W ABF2 Mitochondrial DNA-binding protein involved in mitochondrial DNA replication and recombination, member of HMG1 DNA-binding protein family [Maudiozyma saulgeensis]|uniref:Similar to Saccharomyces cerevisiae YMR072W ABF2 Mitochondrial DNA-binding protein involved in mitochondrial DNA replication and recombination, member of HMG1 DNA-binding protein family n=1 Tax=Maudiozyma saulgeensis TaxID=1789683 RepID=A0A1X7R861_9SACH|nr:similar to Saccharomyces cerevisiae YMR072W ABF2 Mitochondrial DNA-binding protein involved in mitochondrial DNA replication and recombination, member of HMG1 DNA-binding protein family [Kazachstania saulgeensis]
MLSFSRLTASSTSLSLCRTFSTGSIMLAARGIPSAAKLRILKKEEIMKNKPKRPLNSYLLYCAEQRPIISKNHPEMKNPDMTKLISQQWNSLSDIEKQPYKDNAARNSEAHSIMMGEFSKTLPPKKPAGPFVLFANEIRPKLNEEYPMLDFVEKSKITSTRWKALDEESKAHYGELYSRKMKEWQEQIDRM